MLKKGLKSFIFEWEITSFSKTMLHQKEQFLTTFNRAYYQQLSYVATELFFFILTIILSNFQ